MASAPDDVLLTTPGKSSFTRLTRLLICGGTVVLRELFDSKNPSTHTFLTTNKRRLHQMMKTNFLTNPQWKSLFPTNTTCGKSTDFDITLIFKLLREFCSLTAPPKGWNELPDDRDLTLPADLARIKYYRNDVYAHVNDNMELNDTDFQDLWIRIKDALLRIVKHYDTSAVSRWEEAIEELQTDPLSEEAQEYKEVLEEWYRQDQDVKKMISNATQNIQKDIRVLKAQLDVPSSPDLIVKCMIKVASTGSWLLGSGYILYRYRDDPDNFLRMVKEFVLPTGVLVLGISRGSFKIHIQAVSLSGLEEFWKRYETGQLKEDLEKVLITEDLKQFASKMGIQGQLELEVNVSKEEYENARRHLPSVEEKTPALPVKPKKAQQEKKGKSQKAGRPGNGKKEIEKKKVLKEEKVSKQEKVPKQEKVIEEEKVQQHPPTSITEIVSEETTGIGDIREEQFIRLTRLLVLGNPIFRELFDSKFPPKDLASKLKEPAVFKILSRMRGKKFSETEWDILFPDSRSPYLVESKAFSMDLLFKLLEEICYIVPPAGIGWNNQPDPKDKSLGAQLARFKWYRLGIYGQVYRYRELTDEKFHSYWTNVKDVLLDIVRNYDVSKVEGYRMAIDELLLISPISGYPDITLRSSFKLLWALHGDQSMGISHYVQKSFNSKPENLMKLEAIFPSGILVRAVTHGSLKIVLWAVELNALEGFWRRYKTVPLKLNGDLRKALVTEEIKTMTTGGKVKIMSMNVDDKDYEDARENLLSYTAFESHGFTEEEERWEIKEEPGQYDIEEHTDHMPGHPSQVQEQLIDILHGEPLEDRTSIFRAHLAVITSCRQVRSVLRELRIQEKNVADAAFVVWAYRISDLIKKFYAENNVGSYQYFAGRRVFNLLQQEDATNVMLIVTCCQGDVPALGMDTYDNISKCARKLLHSFLKSPKKMADDSKSKFPPS